MCFNHNKKNLVPHVFLFLAAPVVATYQKTEKAGEKQQEKIIQ